MLNDQPAQEILIKLANNTELGKLGFEKIMQAVSSQLILSAMNRNGNKKFQAAIDLQMSIERFNWYNNKIHERKTVIQRESAQANLFARLVANKKPCKTEKLIEAEEKCARLKKEMKKIGEKN